MPGSPNYIDNSGLEVSTCVGLWPFKEKPIRIWAGSIQLNGTNLKGPITYKLRCKCVQHHAPYWKCRKGSGTLTKGELTYITIKLAEMAIYKSQLILLVNQNPINLELYKLPGSDIFFWGIDTSNEYVTKNRNDGHTPWQQPNRVMGAYEIISTLIKPLFHNLPEGLSNYLKGGHSNTSSMHSQLFALIHPVVLDVLVDLGDFAKKERIRSQKGTLASEELVGYNGNDLVELVLIRLTEKLRAEQSRKVAQETIAELNGY